MIDKRTICVVSSSRADYNHLYLLMNAINESHNLELKIIVTGMHMIKEFGYTYNEILHDGFIINKKIKSFQKKYKQKNILDAMSNILKSSHNAIKSLKPDIVVILGDRYDIYPISIACHIMQIPVAHFHGGELTTGAIDDAIRHSISKMSDIHFTAHKEFKKRLIQLGENSKNIYNVGSLGVDSIKQIKYKSKNYIYSKYNLSKESKYFIICIHPETISSNNEAIILNLLKYIYNNKSYSYIFTYPNSDAHSNIILRHIKKYVLKNDNCQLIKSAGRYDFLHLIKYSSGIIGNSSSGITEAPSLNVPTLNIGLRQNGRPFGNSIYQASSSYKSIAQAMNKLIHDQKKRVVIKSIYQGKNTIQKVIKLLSTIKLDNIKNKTFKDNINVR